MASPTAHVIDTWAPRSAAWALDATHPPSRERGASRPPIRPFVPELARYQPLDPAPNPEISPSLVTDSAGPHTQRERIQVKEQRSQPE